MVIESQHMAEQCISSLGDDILNTWKVGPVDNFCVSVLCIPRIIRWERMWKTSSFRNLPGSA